MSPEQLAMIAGAVLSLLFSYVPGLNTWYGGLSSLFQRLIMIGVLALTAGGIYGVACLGLAPWLGLEVVCDAEGAWSLVMVFFTAVVGNQGTYLLTPPPKAVRAAKSAR